MKVMEDCPLSFVPVFYARYVDDILVLLKSHEHIARLSNFLSSKHVNIRFTFEVENNGILPIVIQIALPPLYTEKTRSLESTPISMLFYRTLTKEGYYQRYFIERT